MTTTNSIEERMKSFQRRMSIGAYDLSCLENEEPVMARQKEQLLIKSRFITFTEEQSRYRMPTV
ncbi:MAG: hypothetical protein ABIC95_00290 [archaeon]